MRPSEVEGMLAQIREKEEKITPKVIFAVGDRVKVGDGPFQNQEGVVEEVDTERGRVRVAVSIFGRSTPWNLSTGRWRRPKEIYGKRSHRHHPFTDSRRCGESRSSGGSSPRTTGRQHHGVLQGIQRPHGQGGGSILPVVITVYKDKSFTFITKSPPASILLKKAANLASGSKEPNRIKVGKVTKKQVMDIVKIKRNDLNAASDEAAFRIIAGTARQMGLEIAD